MYRWKPAGRREALLFITVLLLSPTISYILPTKPTQTTEPTESTEPTKSTEPTESIEPTESTEPTEPAIKIPE